MAYIANYMRARAQSPREMIIFVTNRCNARCEHCFFWKEIDKPTQELTLEQFEEIASSLHLDYLNLTGGEAFLRDDIVEICKIFNNHTKNMFIPTNGLLTDRICRLTKEILESCDFNLTVEVSLDGMKKTHDSIRGMHVFGSAVKTIKKLKGIVPVNVLTVVSNLNYSEVEKLADFVHSLGVMHGISIVRGNPRSSRTLIHPDKIDDVHRIVRRILEKNMPERTVKERIAKRLKLKSLDYTIEVLNGRKRKLVTCLAGRDIGVIYPNGDVSVCEMLKPIGNLKDFGFDFKALWNSEKADAIRKSIKDCYCIHDCFMAPSMLYSLKTFLPAAWGAIC